MLGEGARTAADAARYFDSYAACHRGDRRARGNAALPAAAGNFGEALGAASALRGGVARARAGRVDRRACSNWRGSGQTHDLNFTVDAEEADRLELSLEVIGTVLADPSLAGWDGFGLAVQAYQKRAGAVIDWLDEAADALDRRLMVRLVKGAYWDTEVKRAQERGLPDYPVFTRKAMTDLCYHDLHARKLLRRGHGSIRSSPPTMR